MKKKLCALLAAVLAMSSLAGCGNKVSEEDVTVVHVWSSEGGAANVWREIIDEYNATTGKKKGIEIDWETITDVKQFEVAQQNGQLPEIFSGATRNHKIQWAAKGDILPIEDFEGGKEFLEDFNSVTVENNNMFDGKVYSVLYNTIIPGLIYNKDLFKQAGIVDENGEAMPPKTTADALEAAKKIDALGGDIYGFSLPLAFEPFYLIAAPMSRSFKYGKPTLIDWDTITVDTSGYLPAIQWLLDMKEAGCLFPGAETLDNDTSRAYFAEGKVGMMPAMSWDVGVLTSQFVAKCDWDVTYYPTIDEEPAGPNWYDPSGGFTLSKNAKNLPDEKVMEVYKFLHSDEVRITMFERGINIPCHEDVIAKADKSKVDPRFLKFAEMLDESYPIHTAPVYTTEGDGLKNIIQKVWMGQADLEESLKDFGNRNTAGLRKAVEKGDVDQAYFKELYKGIYK